MENNENNERQYISLNWRTCMQKNGTQDNYNVWVIRACDLEKIVQIMFIVSWVYLAHWHVAPNIFKLGFEPELFVLV